MTRLWLVLLFFLGVGLSAVWVADHPGDVVIRWGDWRIDTSLAFLLVLATVAAWLLTWVYTLLRDLAQMPKHYAERRQLKHYEQGLESFTYSVAALAASDIARAESYAGKAQKLLGSTPLGLLLSAQIAKSRGDDKKTLPLLEQMLEHKETEYLAARLLSDAASKQQSLSRAMSLAERAHAVNPKDALGLASVVSLKLKMGEFQEALAFINRAAFKRRAAKSEIVRWRGLTHLAQANACLEKGQAEIAVSEAKKSLHALSDFVPAVLVAARAFDANHRPRTAIRLLEKAWKRTAHPQLAALLQTLAAKLPERKQARLQKMLDAAKTEDAQRSWHCRSCGHTAFQWEMHCASCGAFDAQDWR